MEIAIQENSQYGLVVSSRTIAEQLGKRHDHVIRDLKQILENPNVGSLNSENSNLSSLIIPSTYKAEGQKRSYKEYLLTKDGFTLYMFNIQGYQDFKMAYIQKFNEMEKIIHSRERLENCCQKKLNYEDYIPTHRERIESTRRMIDKEIKNIEKEMKIIQEALMNIKGSEASIKLYMLQV